MTATGVIPPQAVEAWGRLDAALLAWGPAPCEESAAPEMWWIDRGGPLLDAAVAACKGCPVRNECLAYATAAGERWGVWGGLTAEERSR